MKKEFSLLIKPASADCNLRCEYCFYLEKKNLYPAEVRHRMSDEILERLIKSYMETDQPMYSFGWQGGEPLLMGHDFFERAVTLQKKHGRPGSVVGNGVQTNAVLIDERMAQLFSRYKFLMGCSLDGPAGLHDHYRCFADGRPTHQRVLEGIERLEKHGVEFNILVLVNRRNVQEAKTVYQYLKSKGFYYQQYIPCVEFENDGSLTDFSISGAQWGRFLCDIFDQWYPDDVYTVSVRHFDSVLVKQVDGICNVCTMGRSCDQYFVVEYNGDVYPCDFFVSPENRLGNIMSVSWEELLSSERYREFALRKQQWNAICDDCEWLHLCHGDCQKHRQKRNDGINSVLCEGWKQFYAHSAAGFRNLAKKIREERNAESQQRARQPSSSARVGRNKPCPCGSGKKYKKCCGKKE